MPGQRSRSEIFNDPDLGPGPMPTEPESLVAWQRDVAANWLFAFGDPWIPLDDATPDDHLRALGGAEIFGKVFTEAYHPNRDLSIEIVKSSLASGEVPRRWNYYAEQIVQHLASEVGCLVRPEYPYVDLHGYRVTVAKEIADRAVADAWRWGARSIALIHGSGPVDPMVGPEQSGRGAIKVALVAALKAGRYLPYSDDPDSKRHSERPTELVIQLAENRAPGLYKGPTELPERDYPLSPKELRRLTFYH